MEVVLFMALVGLVYAEYDCACNYSVEKNVYRQPTTTGPVLGYLYEFDCKELLHLTANGSAWHTVAFEHKVGFLEKGDDIEVQSCTGTAPDSDRVTFTSPSSPAVSTSPTPTSTTATDTTHIVTAATYTSTIASTTTTTTVVTTPFTEPTTEASTTTLTTSSTSTTQKVTTTPLPTTTQPPTTAPTTDAKRLCPQKLLAAAPVDQGIVIVDIAERKCYELIELHTSWDQAVQKCRTNGGVLATIRTQQQNELIHKYILSLDQHKTWIGLNDKTSTGHFRWVAGDPLSYTNWKDDISARDHQSCIVMDPITGLWNDEICNWSFPYICEFDIETGVAGVLIG